MFKPFLCQCRLILNVNQLALHTVLALSHWEMLLLQFLHFIDLLLGYILRLQCY
jgi:uncharacterized membrane protein